MDKTYRFLNKESYKEKFILDDRKKKQRKTERKKLNKLRVKKDVNLLQSKIHEEI